MNMITDETEQEQEEWTYAEIFSKLLETSAMTMTILKSEVDGLKKGIINAKQASRKRSQYHGLPWETITLEFTETECEDAEERDFYTDLTVAISRKARIKIKRISAPKAIELCDD